MITATSPGGAAIHIGVPVFKPDEKPWGFVESNRITATAPATPMR